MIANFTQLKEQLLETTPIENIDMALSSALKVRLQNLMEWTQSEMNKIEAHRPEINKEGNVGLKQSNHILFTLSSLI